MQPSAKTRTHSQAFQDAMRGIAHAFRRERHMRFHVAAACAVVIAGFALRVSLSEWALLVIAIALVLTAELINAAIEAAVDIATRDYNETARFAKDVAAGGVLISALGAAMIGLIVFGPRLVATFANH